MQVLHFYASVLHFYAGIYYISMQVLHFYALQGHKLEASGPRWMRINPDICRAGNSDVFVTEEVYRRYFV